MANIVKLKHSVDAKHVKNVGEQSVSSPIQAILELVKNSYDADAKSCTVHFYTNTSLEKYLDVYKIVIEDDGVGMSLQDLEKKWMRIGTENKERVGHSPIYQRRVAGEKGMGHFAAQKLGDKIKLVSNPEDYQGREKTSHLNKTLVLTIDWTKYKPGKLFTEIENEVEILPRENLENHGIKIEITELKDDWTKEDIEEVQIALGNLLVPKMIRKSMAHPFEPKVVPHNFELRVEEVESNLEKYASYEIKSNLRGDMVHYTIYKMNKKEKKRVAAPYINERAPGSGKFGIGDITCGDASLRLFHYRGRALGKEGWAPKSLVNRKELETQLKENCGIKIFNDDIRIMPYGEPGNDWVGLEPRVIRRRAGHIRNEQTIGYVFLTREKNDKIIETTTRQALVENKEFEALRDKFVLQVIEKLERYIEEFEKKKKAEGVHEEPKAKAEVEIKQLMEFIETLDIPSQEKKAQKTRVSAVENLLEKQEQRREEEVEEITTNLEMYRNLASLGISALAFHHEVIEPLSGIEARQSKLIDKWDSWDDEKKLDYINKSLKDVWTIEDLNTYIREFATLFKGARGTKRRREEIDISGTLKRFKEGFENILETHKIELEIQKGPGSFSGLYMNLASFESIMLNLISNSIRALLRVSRSKKLIRVSFEKTLTFLTIRVYDNGYGIDAANPEDIFEPFWTTYRGHHEYGTGMGTTIVREIVEDEYDGEVYVEKSICEKKEQGKGKTTFLIKIPIEELKKGNKK